MVMPTCVHGGVRRGGIDHCLSPSGHRAVEVQTGEVGDAVMSGYEEAVLAAADPIAEDGVEAGVELGDAAVDDPAYIDPWVQQDGGETRKVVIVDMTDHKQVDVYRLGGRQVQPVFPDQELKRFVAAAAVDKDCLMSRRDYECGVTLTHVYEVKLQRVVKHETVAGHPARAAAVGYSCAAGSHFGTRVNLVAVDQHKILGVGSFTVKSRGT
jgi:hypothetical protein